MQRSFSFLFATIFGLGVSCHGADSTPLSSKLESIRFEGVHYLGYRYHAPKSGDASGVFETRRNYLQFRGYFNQKDYFRLTLDAFNADSYPANGKDGSGDSVSQSDLSKKGGYLTRIKYAYLYLDNVLPHTGLEMGIAHRPWIDYEEHSGWWHRAISKVFSESYYGAHLMNSADGGFNLKTKTDRFSSEIGIFNGEGYHDTYGHDGGEFFNSSVEFRATWHALPLRRYKLHPDFSYANLSLFGMKSFDHKGVKEYDRQLLGLHGVYNQPAFLVALQYIANTEEKNGDTAENKGFSINGEWRFGEKWTLLGRHDAWDKEGTEADPSNTIVGIAYDYHPLIRFIANGRSYENYDGTLGEDGSEFLLTAYIHY